MSVLGGLLGELKGVFGKTYLLAGLLPASFLAGGLYWLWHDGALQDATGALTKGFTDAGSALAGTAALTLLGGIAIFSMRAFLVESAQQLRFLPEAARHWLIGRQLRYKQQLSDKFDVLNRQAVAIDWALRDFKDGPPSKATMPDDTEAAWLRSREARKVFDTLVRDESQPAAMDPNLGPQVAAALLFLHVYWSRADRLNAHYVDEVTAWRKTMQSVRGPQMLASQRELILGQLSDVEGAIAETPKSDWLSPTTLGMVGSALDEYAQARYQIDTRSLISRLWTLLPDSDRDAISDSKLSVEVSLTMAFASFLLSVAALGRILWNAYNQASTSVRSVLFVVVPLALVWVFYEGAIVAHRSFADRVIRSIDLHRLKLLSAMGYPFPETAGEERRYWTDLAAFLTRAHPLDPSRPTRIKP
jgi:hypothetical protein